MKKILSITIALCLVFASVLPIYAEAWTSQQATNVTSGVAQILAQLLQISSKLGSIDSSGRSVLDNILLSINQLAGWLVPDGARPSSAATLLDSVIVLTNYAMNHLPDISVISGYVASWMQQNNAYLNTTSITNTQIRDALSNVNYYTGSFNPKTNAQDLLFTHNQDGSLVSNWVNLGQIAGSNGYINNQHAFNWANGTPLGNIAYMLRMVTLNQSNGYKYVWDAALTDYTGQLGIWDSQGDTLSQEAWSPTSAINGLYKYLAYTQRDVARLTYVLASDEEIETREKARETQTEVMDDFIDPDGNAAASIDNFGEIASGSANVKQNFSTGYSVSNMWSAFGSEHYGWFSQECANALDTSAASSSGNRLLKNDKHDESNYDTPLLDEYYRQILSLGGGNDD